MIPAKIEMSDFGRNQFGQCRGECAFTDLAEEGGGGTAIRSKEEYGQLLEFAETNDLIRERNRVFRG